MAGWKILQLARQNGCSRRVMKGWRVKQRSHSHDLKITIKTTPLKAVFPWNSNPLPKKGHLLRQIQIFEHLESRVSRLKRTQPSILIWITWCQLSQFNQAFPEPRPSPHDIFESSFGSPRNLHHLDAHPLGEKMGTTNTYNIPTPDTSWPEGDLPSLKSPKVQKNNSPTRGKGG